MWRPARNSGCGRARSAWRRTEEKRYGKRSEAKQPGAKEAQGREEDRGSSGFAFRGGAGETDSKPEGCEEIELRDIRRSVEERYHGLDPPVGTAVWSASSPAQILVGETSWQTRNSVSDASGAGDPWPPCTRLVPRPARANGNREPVRQTMQSASANSADGAIEAPERRKARSARRFRSARCRSRSAHAGWVGPRSK